MYRYKPAEMVHLVNDADAGATGTTLCGLAHDEELREVGANPDDVLPTHQPYCQRCRAVYVDQVMSALGVDVTDLAEGDVIEFWTHDDPTDVSSSTCIRSVGEIVDVPPWTETYNGETHTITGCYNVHEGGSMYSHASFDRIWRVNDDALN